MKRAQWKTVRFFEPARKELHDGPSEVKKELGAVLTRLQKGESIGMPDVRPMLIVGKGAAEIRVLDRTGCYRTFFIVRDVLGILVFHAFVKKTQKTPEQELKTGQARLRRFLEELEVE